PGTRPQPTARRSSTTAGTAGAAWNWLGWTWVASRGDVRTNFPATLTANAARRLIRRRYADRPGASARGDVTRLRCDRVSGQMKAFALGRMTSPIRGDAAGPSTARRR